MERKDDYLQRRKDLTKLADEELYQRFWELTEKIVDPLIKLGKEYTTPSIERSVLLRMGFSSLEAKEIVSCCQEHDLLRKGAGHVVWKLAQKRQVSIRDAGLALCNGAAKETIEEVKGLFQLTGAGGQE
ncbi:ornithine aminomutase subunit alpha [Candidatus Acetothermia bacterium]|nr:ornithine aminomutase subunit alpha [Candidatus Acetothermia bacterium]